MQRNRSASGFCVGCDLLAVLALQAFTAGAERQQPVGAHLQALVQLLHRIVVEGVALGALVARRPDQRLVRVGEALALEVRHRVGLAPHDVVQQPEAEVLQRRADAEDVVVAADHPQRALGLEHAPRRAEPGAGEGIVARKACPEGIRGLGELVPVVVDRVDAAVVGTQKLAAQLQIVGRIGEHHVDGRFGQASHQLDAVAYQDVVQFISEHRWKMSHPPSPGQEITIDSIVYGIDPQDRVGIIPRPTRPRPTPPRSPCARRHARRRDAGGRSLWECGRGRRRRLPATAPG